MSLLRQLGIVRRDMQVDPNLIPSNASLSPPTFSGVAVTEMRALQQLTVLSCVGLITDSISMLPIGAFRRVAAARQPISPDPAIVANPHEEMEAYEWLGRMLVSLLLRGNAYGWIIDRDRLGFATQVWPLHPDEVGPVRNRDTGRIEYKVAGERAAVPRADMVHVRGLTLPGRRSIEGLSPIEYARQTIGLALATEEFGARFFGDGAHPSGVLESDVPMAKLKEEAVDRILTRWTQAHGNRQRKPAVLTGGLKWKPVSVSPEEAQFLETQRFSRGAIAGFYRVPPHMIGDVERSTSWGTGIEEQSLGYVTFCLQPWIVRLETALSRLLPRPQYVKFNVAGLLRGRLLNRYQAYLMGRQGGWLSIDDIRALEEMAPLPEDKGGDYLLPLNFAPIPPGGAAAQPPDSPASTPV